MRTILPLLVALFACAVFVGGIGCADQPTGAAAGVSAGGLASATLVVAGMT